MFHKRRHDDPACLTLNMALFAAGPAFLWFIAVLWALFAAAWVYYFYRPQSTMRA